MFTIYYWTQAICKPSMGIYLIYLRWQKQYMIDAFERNRNKIKFVNYHVPIYSVCEAFDSNPERFLFALFHWVPNFDKYKVMTAFENHVHSFKRTKPLVGSSPT